MTADCPVGLVSASASKPDPIALFDLDGTLANFDGGMEAGMLRLATPQEIADGVHFPREQDDEPDHIRERRRAVKRQPGFWRDLEVLPLGKQLLDHAILLGFEVSILTKAPKKNFAAWSEKVEWCWRNLPMDEADIGVNLVTNKGLVYGRLLVDDYPPYIAKWLAHRPRGTVIMPAWPWNEGFQHPQVFRVSEAEIPRALDLISGVKMACE